MTARIELLPPLEDGRVAAMAPLLPSATTACYIVDVITVDADLSESDLRRLAADLARPLQPAPLVFPDNGPAAFGNYPAFDLAVDIGFLPGVTDNTGSTVRQIAEDALKRPLDGHVYSSRRYLFAGPLALADGEAFAGAAANSLIEQTRVIPAENAREQGLPPLPTPRVTLSGGAEVLSVDLEISEDDLTAIGKKGIPDPDGTRRGPLGLRPAYMETIRDHFRTLGRAPTDVELETLAQTWSEHCKHTIFAAPLDEVKDGLYRHYLKRATRKVRARMGEADFCVSVFSDNAGAIVFDDNWLIADKVETHNSPSALDPFGGALTGIVGVNRDALGFGMGAKPVINRYGFCLADPDTRPGLYRAPERENPALTPRAIMNGVIRGVEEGGNCSGIPTPQGFMVFDQRYAGKPLVFAGTVGLIPREVAGRPAHRKAARPGDRIVMVGGRVGKDGIHGATFSSEALDSGSPATAVQIGDPITQKKMSDALIREARDQGLYSAITDNGAGGLSSSVGEMAEDPGGFIVDLEKVPLKYPGLAPWEIWISESQERMTVAVPPENVDAFIALMARRDVEAADIGEFTDESRAVVRMNGRKVMDMDMDFLHNGLPEIPLESRATNPAPSAPERAPENELESVMGAMAGRLNLCGREIVDSLFDHEVQGSSVTKPVQGPGRVHADATVSRPVPDTLKGVVTSQGLTPRYSDIDTHAMALAAMDNAVRAAVAAGGNPAHMALLDNFCWCDGLNPERLWQLKRAAQACYTGALAFMAPFVSGKDSMFNDFRGYDAESRPLSVSVPPTLLISTLSVMEDIRRAVTLDAKMPGDAVYIVGTTKDECGGSEYFAHLGGTGSTVPRVDPDESAQTCKAVARAIADDLPASAVALHAGGLAHALVRTAVGGLRGLHVDLNRLPTEGEVPLDARLFSETGGRFLITVGESEERALKAALRHRPFTCIGAVTDTDRLIVEAGRKTVANLSVSGLHATYHGGLS